MGPRRASRKSRPEGGAPKVPFLQPYLSLTDTVEVRSWKVFLGFDGTVWELVVRDGKKIIAKGESAAEAPACFVQMAAQCRRVLELAKLLNE